MNWQLCISSLLDKGLTIEEIAAAIGVTPSAIREVIAGRTKSPRAEAAMLLLDLCRAHGVDVQRAGEGEAHVSPLVAAPAKPEDPVARRRPAADGSAADTEEMDDTVAPLRASA